MKPGNRTIAILVTTILGLARAGSLAPAAQLSAPEPGAVRIGEKVPNLTLRDTKGQVRKLSDFAGRTVILEWINPECPYVVRHYRSGSMQRTYRRVKSIDDALVWLAIDSTSTASAQKGKAWIDRYKLEYPILLDPDGKVGRTYDARRTPHMYVIDAGGILRYHGAIDDNHLDVKKHDQIRNYVVNAVRQLKDEEAVNPDRVKPYGCSIKYRR